MHWESSPIVRRGSWDYDGLRREVRIVLHPVYYGTGDYEDEPEVADGRDEPTFVVLYETCAQPGGTFAGGGQFSTLAAAMASAADVLRNGLQWHDAN